MIAFVLFLIASTLIGTWLFTLGAPMGYPLLILIVGCVLLVIGMAFAISDLAE